MILFYLVTSDSFLILERIRYIFQSLVLSFLSGIFRGCFKLNEIEFQITDYLLRSYPFLNRRPPFSLPFRRFLKSHRSLTQSRKLPSISAEYKSRKRDDASVYLQPAIFYPGGPRFRFRHDFRIRSVQLGPVQTLDKGIGDVVLVKHIYRGQ